MGRVEDRVDRILAAAGKLKAKLDAEPDHPKADGWRQRMAEYKQSLENFQKHGVESPRGTNPGVKIKIPTALFNVSGKSPGG